MNKILVTGANGYIGRHVVKSLLDFGFIVIASDIKNDGIDERAKFVGINIFDESIDYYKAFDEPDTIIHLAWRDGFNHNAESHLIDLPKHIHFLHSLIDSGIKKVVGMGSMHEVGYHEGVIDENTERNPKTNYAISKCKLYDDLNEYTKGTACRFIWLRAFYIYGDDERGCSIFGKLVKSAKEGNKTFPFTDGKSKFDFISVEELAHQICMAAGQHYVLGIINCCSGKPVSLGEKVESFIKENNLDISLEYGKFPPRPYDSPCIYGDNTKIKTIKHNFYVKHKRILVTGAKGQLGGDLMYLFKRYDFQNVLGIDKDNFSLTDISALDSCLYTFRPELIIHCAGWTNVDKAETNKKEALEINYLATSYLASYAKENDCKFVFLSTDYVFDGRGNKPHEVDEKKRPLSVYGLSKQAAEDFIISNVSKYFIVRTSWAFGYNDYSNNFIKTMLKHAKTDDELYVVSDQVGSPTSTYDLAKFLLELIETEKYGIYHCTNEGFVSWYDFAKFIFDYIGVNKVVHPITTEEYRKLHPDVAARPLNSRLSKKCLTDNDFALLPNWQDATRRYLDLVRKNYDL